MSQTTAEEKGSKSVLLFKSGTAMPQTCARLSGTLSVQSVERRCSFLLTETEFRIQKSEIVDRLTTNVHPLHVWRDSLSSRLTLESVHHS